MNKKYEVCTHTIIYHHHSTTHQLATPRHHPPTKINHHHPPSLIKYSCTIIFPCLDASLALMKRQSTIRSCHAVKSCPCNCSVVSNDDVSHASCDVVQVEWYRVNLYQKLVVLIDLASFDLVRQRCTHQSILPSAPLFIHLSNKSSNNTSAH